MMIVSHQKSKPRRGANVRTLVADIIAEKQMMNIALACLDATGPGRAQTFLTRI